MEEVFPEQIFGAISEGMLGRISERIHTGMYAETCEKKRKSEALS